MQGSVPSLAGRVLRIKMAVARTKLSNAMALM